MIKGFSLNYRGPLALWFKKRSNRMIILNDFHPLFATSVNTRENFRLLYPGFLGVRSAAAGITLLAGIKICNKMMHPNPTTQSRKFRNNSDRRAVRGDRTPRRCFPARHRRNSEPPPARRGAEPPAIPPLTKPPLAPSAREDLLKWRLDRKPRCFAPIPSASREAGTTT